MSAITVPTSSGSVGGVKVVCSRDRDYVDAVSEARAFATDSAFEKLNYVHQAAKYHNFVIFKVPARRH